MPVDIRNFFAKKPPSTNTATKTNDSKASSSSSNKKPDTKSTNNASSNKTSVSVKKAKSETATTTNVKNKDDGNKNNGANNDNAATVVRKPNETKKSTSTTTATSKTTTTTTAVTRNASDKKRNSMANSGASNNKKRLVIVDSDEDDDDYVVPIDDSEDDQSDNNNKGSKLKSKATTPMKRKDVPNDESKYFRNKDANKPSIDASTKVGAPSPQKKLRASPRSEIIQEEKDTSVARRISPRKPPPPKQQEPSPDSDNDVIEIITKTPPKPVTSSRTTSSTLSKPIANKVTRSNSSSTAKQRKQAKQQQQQRDPPLQPEIEADYFDINTAVVPQLLEQYTFVLSGVLESLSREDAQEMIKVLGGRVTTAVSSKTDYLVVGMELEDGRPYTEGSKYKKATDLGTTIIVHGERALFGLLKQYNDKAAASAPGHDDEIPLVKSLASSPMVASSSRSITNESPTVTKVQSKNDKPQISSNNNVSSASVAVAAKPPPFNPYSKGMTIAMANPYASKNPYAKKAQPSSSDTKNSYATKPATKTDDRKMAATSSSSSSGGNQLWVDKFKPTHSNEVLGNQDAVRKLSTWLATWEDRFNNPQSIGKSFSAPSGPWKAALLSGPPGIGKTTTATLVAQESGRDVLEFNASDVRSKKAMQEVLGDITGSRTIEFTMKASGKSKTPQRTKRCIIMDEVDGMGGGDRSGISELIQMIKHSRVPIICICNDRQNQKLKSLIPYCMDLKYRRPVKSVIANRAVEIAEREGLHVERNAAEAIVESCGNDVRQVLNCLQMWASSGTKTSNNMTYKDLKDREHSINKDEILRVGLFDATRLIVEGRKGLAGADLQTERNNFFQRNDAFFVDYSFIGLMVQQNYLKVMQGQFNEVKRLNDDDGTLSFLDRMSDAANTMSEFAVVENSMRDGQGWSLLPFSAALAVKTGFHAGGDRGGMLPGFPEFTTWLGRNSTKGKKVRMLKELGHHMNFNISAGTQELRLSYLPVLRERFLSILTNNKNPNVDGAIELMDEYGLDRNDLFEKIEEFKMDPKGRDLSSMDSKMKAAFTRAYNLGVHKSQALVAEQGATGRKGKRQGANPVMESADLDAIDDDNLAEVDEENDDEEEELNEEKIKELFKKKGRGGGGSRSASNTKARGSKKK